MPLQKHGDWHSEGLSQAGNWKKEGNDDRTGDFLIGMSYQGILGISMEKCFER